MTDSLIQDGFAALRRRVFHHQAVSEKALAELANLFVMRRHPRDKTLVAAGERWEKIFYIHEGIVRLFYTDEDGREFNKFFFWEDQLLWPVAPSARGREIRFTIAALEEITVSVCPFESFYSWLNLHGYWERFALPYAELIAEHKFQREYEFLMNSATERFHNFCVEYPGLVGRIPDYHIASYLELPTFRYPEYDEPPTFNLC